MAPAGRSFPWVPFLAALPLLLLLHAAASATSAPPANPHGYFQQPAQCPKCHLYAGPNLDPARFLTSSVDFCLECHIYEERGRTHPVKVHPDARAREAKIPPEFRMGDGEHLICLTCHSAHGTYASPATAFAGQMPIASDGGQGPYYKTYFLRRTDPSGEGFEAMCGACHKVP